MIDYATAIWSVLGLVLALGMLFFSLRLSFFFKGGFIVRGWNAFALSSVFLVGISALSTAEAVQFIGLPSWWREGSAFAYRLTLFYAMFEVYRSWRKIGR